VSQLDLFAPAVPWQVRWLRFFWLRAAYGLRHAPELRRNFCECLGAAHRIRREWRSAAKIPPTEVPEASALATMAKGVPVSARESAECPQVKTKAGCLNVRPSR
jgi:hypothetical protein